MGLVVVFMELWLALVTTMVVAMSLGPRFFNMRWIRRSCPCIYDGNEAGAAFLLVFLCIFWRRVVFLWFSLPSGLRYVHILMVFWKLELWLAGFLFCIQQLIHCCVFWKCCRVPVQNSKTNILQRSSTYKELQRCYVQRPLLQPSTDSHDLQMNFRRWKPLSRTQKEIYIVAFWWISIHSKPRTTPFTA